MPNRLEVWNEKNQCGNPTRLSRVNEIVKDLKKQECRGSGDESKARRPVEEREWEELVSVSLTLFC